MKYHRINEETTRKINREMKKTEKVVVLCKKSSRQNYIRYIPHERQLKKQLLKDFKD